VFRNVKGKFTHERPRHNGAGARRQGLVLAARAHAAGMVFGGEVFGVPMVDTDPLGSGRRRFLTPNLSPPTHRRAARRRTRTVRFRTVLEFRI